ncbi:MAG: DUF1565 domain-containing protein [Methanobrevibacter sp.]|jgi:hypothetical protein|nr:DUF1565 domain-containing protein [Candidatus Methanovirga procula]
MFNKKIFFAVMILAILSAIVGSVVGGQDATNTVYVSPSRNDGNTGTSDAPFKTIKKAVEVAPNGGTVFIKSGLYYAKDGNSNILIDKDLNIVGEDKETTTIDCSDVKNTLNDRGELVRSHIFKFSPPTTGSNQTFKVKNLTFQNQDINAQYTIEMYSDSNATVESCDFINNQGVYLIYAFNYDKGSLTNCNIKVLNCSFTNNSMRMGLAEIRNGGGSHGLYSTVVGCNIVNNSGGYAALSLGYDSLVSDSYFSGNTGIKANDIYHCTGAGGIKLHNTTFVPSRDSSTPSIFNEYGYTIEV